VFYHTKLAHITYVINLPVVTPALTV